MCCSSKLAKFEGTQGYIGEVEHPTHGLVHVMGYQNKAKNLFSGPNAMLLHFPAKEEMTASNVIDLGDAGGKKILDQWKDRLFPEDGYKMSKSSSRGFTNSVQVFDTGIYMVVMSPKPSLITSALAEVPENKRPEISAELLAWYETHYPGWTLAVCCFDNRDAIKADPLFWWYKPLDPMRLHFPAVDSHDGTPPKLEHQGRAWGVHTDHVIVLGSDKFLPNGKAEKLKADYRDVLPEASRPFFPERIIGADYRRRRFPNGDFVAPVLAVRAHKSFVARYIPEPKGSGREIVTNGQQTQLDHWF